MPAPVVSGHAAPVPGCEAGRWVGVVLSCRGGRGGVAPDRVRAPDIGNDYRPIVVRTPPVDWL
ncbi:hypothetical protein C6P96_13170 [Burkholderia multivorans]|nr:hypothetical protein C6P96_13170 [Burkholderia multivorans]